MLRRVGACFTSCTTFSWCGDLLHTGSASVASPVIKNAWQRQPPKSLWRSSQVRQGAFIQLSPRKALNALLRCQISAMGVSFTLGSCRPGRSRALWQGMARPSGAMDRNTEPQPFMQALGRSSK